MLKLYFTNLQLLIKCSLICLQYEKQTYSLEIKQANYLRICRNNKTFKKLLD
ncbi:hypothetical protein SAMN05444008_1242 [Cnuella takakiae]|uniref:Uncharacterized protein n=1 Tax=Cnuella takakiae TaxID=1302690 RepID=A0A1M5IIG2_9BACT|nr:hypothetical protein SAMN05444008_1242 [Cnuella takakiae]